MGEAAVSTEAPPRCAVCLQDVHKAYVLGTRRVQALRGINLMITRQGFHGIMGPSGSGKSTLLHLLAALDRPDSGTIEVAGRRIDNLNESDLTDFRRRHIGIVFQRFNLINTLSALDNATLPGMLDGMSSDAHRTRGMELLRLLGLENRADHRPDALSGGEQQRVAIARALFFEPSVLFADEPTGNLDSYTAAQLFELLTTIASNRQMTVLMVTHEPSAAIHCEHVFMLRDGVIESSFDVDGMDAPELATRAQHAGW